MTKEAVTRIKLIYEKMAEESKKAQEQKKAILQDPNYTEQGKEEKIKGIEAVLKNNLSSKIQEVNTLLDKIKEEETKRANEFDINDTAFTNCCNLLNSGYVPYEVTKKILDSYKGKMQNLAVFKQIFDNKELQTTYIDKLLINTDSKLDIIRQTNNSIANNMDSSINKMVTCYDNLIKLSETLGSGYVEYDRTLNIGEEYQTSQDSVLILENGSKLF